MIVVQNDNIIEVQDFKFFKVINGKTYYRGLPCEFFESRGQKLAYEIYKLRKDKEKIDKINYHRMMVADWMGE